MGEAADTGGGMDGWMEMGCVVSPMRLPLCVTQAPTVCPLSHKPPQPETGADLLPAPDDYLNLRLGFFHHVDGGGGGRLHRGVKQIQYLSE